MEPVFTLQWPEFKVCERLQTLLPKSQGYSIYIPLSRQEKGVDISILHRMEHENRTITIQVKSSRTYLNSPAKRKDTIKYRYSTWFNRFTPSQHADYFALIGLFPPTLAQTTKISSNWYSDCTLLFSYREMVELINNCVTVSGKPDSMFGFGFDDLSKIIYTRGDPLRSGRDFSGHTIDKKIHALKAPPV